MEIDFITGADSRYFFMAGALSESLRMHFPQVRVRVMDFGLSNEQRTILKDLGAYIERPPELEPTMHPYRLKASIGRFIGPIAGPTFWIDCDMIAVRPGQDALNAMVQAWASDEVALAMAGDASPVKSLRDFTTRYRCPKTALYLASAPQRGNRPYLNAGFIYLGNDSVIAQWQQRASELEGDTNWEQNALNFMMEEGSPVEVMDNRLWNVHGDLLSSVTVTADGVHCSGLSPFLLHLTSSVEGHIADGHFPVRIAGVETTGYTRLFSMEPLMAYQKLLLSQFVGRHPAMTMT